MKKVFIGVGIMLALAILGLGMYQSNAASKVSILSEKEITDLVSSQYPGEISKIEITEEGNKSVYDITIKGEKAEYALKMDATSGEVLKLKETQVLTVKEKNDPQVNKSEKDNKQSNSEKQGEDNNQKSSTNKVQKDENKETKPNNQQAINKNKEQQNQAQQQSEKRGQKKKTIISREQAIQIALKQFSGTVDDVDLEEDDGRLHYEIEIEQGDREANIEIDAYTGEVLIMEIDD